MLTRYDALYLLGSPVLVPLALHRAMQKKKSAQTLRGMLGLRLRGRTSPYQHQKRVIWVHAVSVGEVVAAKALLGELKRTFPDATLIASTITEAGQEQARGLLNETEEIFFFPLDLSCIVRRFLDFYNPWMYISIETELWPNFLSEARKRGTKIFLANGCLSERSFARYRRFAFLFRKPLAGFSAFLMQTEQDADRMRTVLTRAQLSTLNPALPAGRSQLSTPQNVFVTGNCKFDSSGEPLTEEERARLLAQFGFPPDAPIIVAGSTHPGEEALILQAFAAVRREIPHARLIIAPRHRERFDEVWNVLKQSRFAVARATRVTQTTTPTSPQLSTLNPALPAGRSQLSTPDVLLLDTVGQLARVYGLGGVAVVCGSFVSIGGHNLLEAAVHSIPVIFGPDMHKQPELRELFLRDGSGIEVTAEQLAPTLIALLKDDSRRIALGAKARQTVERNRGSALRTVSLLSRFLT
jgi:3-deoxy-D-manno-octulosonic-acid transferase